MINRIKLLKHFLIPVFTHNGYEMKKTKYNWLCFFQKENNDITVDYDFLPMIKNALEITIRHSKLDDEIKFPVLVDGPENVRWNAGVYMGFDTIDELIGLIEFQSECFEKWIFNFLANKSHSDIFDKINNQRKIRIAEYAKMNQEERDDIIESDMKLAHEIFSRRFYPKKWNLEHFDSNKNST
jgi:hypothetical protein